mmetsp:Transcript_18008/g.32667  ORF Transcript_18008/g.32667 Transcript_18008/m.32667 type:complete len:445 (+) Transcript_18008:82-1416(+)
MAIMKGLVLVGMMPGVLGWSSVAQEKANRAASSVKALLAREQMAVRGLQGLPKGKQSALMRRLTNMTNDTETTTETPCTWSGMSTCEVNPVWATDYVSSLSTTSTARQWMDNWVACDALTDSTNCTANTNCLWSTLEGGYCEAKEASGAWLHEVWNSYMNFDGCGIFESFQDSFTCTLSQDCSESFCESGSYVVSELDTCVAGCSMTEAHAFEALCGAGFDPANPDLSSCDMSGLSASSTQQEIMDATVNCLTSLCPALEPMWTLFINGENQCPGLSETACDSNANCIYLDGVCGTDENQAILAMMGDTCSFKPFVEAEISCAAELTASTCNAMADCNWETVTDCVGPTRMTQDRCVPAAHTYAQVIADSSTCNDDGAFFATVMSVSGTCEAATTQAACEAAVHTPIACTGSTDGTQASGACPMATSALAGFIGAASVVVTVAA